jgi:tetratricopeptide (TPR) repeat protein
MEYRDGVFLKLPVMKMLLSFLLLAPVVVVAQENIDLMILKRNYPEALQHLEKSIQEQPDAALFLKKGMVLSGLQNYQEAVNAFAEGLKIEPGNLEIMAEMADVLSLLGNHHDATTFYECTAEMEPENLIQTGKLGRNYMQLNKFGQAYEVFSKIYQTDSTNVFWNKQLASSAHRIGKPNQAISLYEQIIDLNPRDYSTYFNLIRLYQQTEQFNNVLPLIEKGMEVFPGDAGFYHHEANFYFGNKQYLEAKTTYEKYFYAGGDSLYKVLMNYGISLYFAKDEAKAISILDICADQVANDPYVLFYLSLAHKKLIRLEMAEAYMNAAIESATPAYLPDMYHHLGQIYGMQRMFKESIAALKKANELDPSNHEALFEIATTYEEFNANKTLALNYYNIYLQEAGHSSRNGTYALKRLKRLKEDLFFDE